MWSHLPLSDRAELNSKITWGRERVCTGRLHQTLQVFGFEKVTSAVFNKTSICTHKAHCTAPRLDREDQFNAQESAEERWRPILGVEQVT